MSIADQNFRPTTNPDFNQQYEEYHKVLSLAPENYIRHFMLTGNDAAKLAAAAVMDQKAKAQAAPPAPTQTVIDKLAQPQGLAQLTQGMPQQGPAPAPQQMAQAQGPVAQMADGGIVGLPIDSGMFEGGYAGGGIIAFDDGGDVPGYASQGAVKRPAYLSNPVGKYFNPDELIPYDDTEVQKLLKENPALTMDDIYNKQQEVRGRYGIKDIYEDQRKALEADKAENEKFKESVEADALLNAAAGFLGNTSQFFGPGAEAALKGYTTTKREGQKEYRATAKDIRNLGFEIGRADQTMRQADMAGDQTLYNAERSRRDGLLKQSQEIKFKNTETKNNALAKGWDAAAAYDTNLGVANVRASAKGAGDGYKVNKAVMESAIKMMANAYPAGAMELLMNDRPDVYQAELNRFIQGAETYIKTNELPVIPPSDAVKKLLNTSTGSGQIPLDVPGSKLAPATAANPSALTKATVAGQKVDPKLQAQLRKIRDKYAPSGAVYSLDDSEDEE